MVKTFENGNLYIETYGCQMNFYDSNIVASIMGKIGFKIVNSIEIADIIFINTCSIRENAELKIMQRLNAIKHNKNINKNNTIIGILGCMAERLKNKLLDNEKIIDIVVGPDSYNDLPKLVFNAFNNNKSCNVKLSRTETYDNIIPHLLDKYNISTYISIMRGCDNMCTFCVVPFTRGRERSKNPYIILKEIEILIKQGIKKITLLGQNVDSYNCTINKTNFSTLLNLLATSFPNILFSFTTSHPKDMSDDVIYAIANNDNILKYIHLPVQSGSNRILNIMNRNYSVEMYINKINFIRKIIPNCSISTDIMTGFCSETINDHYDTLNMMNTIKFNFSYMFKYSDRTGTFAHRKLKDNVSDQEKSLRLNDIIKLQKLHSHFRNQQFVTKISNVLVEGRSKKSNMSFVGINEQNYKVVFPKKSNIKKGDNVKVLIKSYINNTLIGDII